MGQAAATTQRRRNAAAAGSILAHGAVFLILGLNASKLIVRPPASTRTTTVWLMPNFSPRSVHLQQSEAKGEVRPAGVVGAAGVPARPPAPLEPSVPASPEAAAAGEAGPAPADKIGAGVNGALRTSVGCSLGHVAHLTPEEKDRCNQRMGEEAHKGPAFIDTIPPEKRAYYDAVQQAYQAAKDPSHPFVRDANGDVHPWGNGPGVGCGLKFGGPPQPPDHRSLTDKIKATGMIGIPLGPLQCGFILPQGSMTPELRIPTP